MFLAVAVVPLKGSYSIFIPSHPSSVHSTLMPMPRYASNSHPDTSVFAVRAGILFIRYYLVHLSIAYPSLAMPLKI